MYFNVSMSIERGSFVIYSERDVYPGKVKFPFMSPWRSNIFTVESVLWKAMTNQHDEGRQSRQYHESANTKLKQTVIVISIKTFKQPLNNLRFSTFSFYSSITIFYIFMKRKINSKRTWRLNSALILYNHYV